MIDVSPEACRLSAEGLFHLSTSPSCPENHRAIIRAAAERLAVVRDAGTVPRRVRTAAALLSPMPATAPIPTIPREAFTPLQLELLHEFLAALAQQSKRKHPPGDIYVTKNMAAALVALRPYLPPLEYAT